MRLPDAGLTARTWRLHDFRYRVETTDPAAGGRCRAVFDQVPQDELWLIDRVVVQSTSASPTAAFLYLDSVDDRNALDGTRVGNFDVADQSAAIQLPGGSTLVIEWQGGDDGAVGTARVQLIILRREGG